MADKRLLDPEIHGAVRAFWEKQTPYVTIVQYLKEHGVAIPLGTLRRRCQEMAVDEDWGKTEKAQPAAAPPQTPAEAAERRISEEQSKNASAEERRILSELAKPTARSRALIDTIRAVTATLPKPEIPQAPFHTREQKLGKPRVVMAVISDLQAGIAVSANEVGGRLAYDSSMLDERWASYERQLWQFIDEQTLLGPLEGISLVVPGDLIENHQMREGARKRTDMQLTASTFRVVALFESLITRLRQRYGVPVIADLVPGNHDRIGGFKPGTELAEENWVVIIGYCLEKAFAADDGVEIHTTLAEYVRLQFGQSKFFIHHGHGIQGTALLPWYGIDRKVTRWEGWARDFNQYVILGHFHTFAAWQTNSGCKVYVNGAWFHTTSYGTGLGLASDAQQIAFALTAEEGIVYTREILLAGRVGPEPTQERFWSNAA